MSYAMNDDFCFGVYNDRESVYEFGFKTISSTPRPRKTIGKTAEELFPLYRQNGDNEYKQGILHECDWVLIKLVQKMGKYTPDLRKDLYIAGYIELEEVIADYNPAFNTKISTYAYPRIANAMQNVIDGENLFGSQQTGKVCRCVKQIIDDRHTAGHNPTTEEIKNKMKQKKCTGNVERAVQAIYAPKISCYQESESDELQAAEIPVPSAGFEAVDLQDQVESMLSTIPSKRDQDILRRFYIDGEKKDSIAKSYGLTRQRIHTICKKRLEEIRRNTLLA